MLFVESYGRQRDAVLDQDEAESIYPYAPVQLTFSGSVVQHHDIPDEFAQFERCFSSFIERLHLLRILGFRHNLLYPLAGQCSIRICIGVSGSLVLTRGATPIANDGRNMDRSIGIFQRHGIESEIGPVAGHCVACGDERRERTSFALGFLYQFEVRSLAIQHGQSAVVRNVPVEVVDVLSVDFFD